MKLRKLTPKKNRAQAMVEFAIALPILLMLLYGLLETGRLLFLYSTIVTASRQAVRYGSATGVGTTTVPRYQDCAGIRAAAQKVDFLNAFDDEDIEIAYDSGPGPLPTPYCVLPLLTDPSFHPTNSSRIQVTIKGDFFPIVPKLVPFIERSAASPRGPIQGISARTILVSVPIEVTNTPDLSPSTPTSTVTASLTSTATATNTLTFTPSPTFTSSPTLQFTLTPSRTPTATLSPTVTLTPAPTMTPTITSTPTNTATPVTPVAGCDQIKAVGGISFSGSSMSLRINNPLGKPVLIQDIFVAWDHDTGHNPPGDKTLRLVSVAWEPTIWSGDSGTASSITIIPSPTTYVQPGTSTLTITFHQAYNDFSGQPTEQIVINLAPVCTPPYSIQATYTQ
jgi:hypothetical protein